MYMCIPQIKCVFVWYQFSDSAAVSFNIISIVGKQLYSGVYFEDFLGNKPVLTASFCFMLPFLSKIKITILKISPVDTLCISRCRYHSI